MGAVDCRRFGRPDVDVCTSRFKPSSYLLGPWVVDGSFVIYKGIQGGFEQLWISGAESAEEPGILQRSSQGCVEPSRGLEDSNLPLSAPTGVQLAPISPKLVQGRFSEVWLNGFSEATTVFRGPPCGARDIADTRRRTVPPPLESRPASFVVTR
jgi:hypothetical protein